MGKKVTVRYEDSLTELRINAFPDICPICNMGIDPRLINGILTEGKFGHVELIFQCPLSECQHIFIGYYYTQPTQGNYDLFILDNTRPMSFQPRKFSKDINSISKDFVNIYNQSEQSEKFDLLEIAGPGYRKALEFLIKDFVIAKIPDKKEEIIKSKLGMVIANHIDDPRIKSTSKRASWLGNDETHYYRKWESNDISDLKKLIGLTVRWIEMVQMTGEYENTMPDN
jgi:hypothetical protein